VLRLLIDTSTWLDLGTRRDGLRWIHPLGGLTLNRRLVLLVPSLVIGEFDRNRPRSEMSVTTSVIDRLRQLRRELREYAGDKYEHVWLAETEQHIPLVSSRAPQIFRAIDELLRGAKILKATIAERERAAQRVLDKRAPFTSDKNSVADAVLIAIYSSQVARGKAGDTCAFVTSNHRDFSVPNGDHRQPHPDLAGLFDGERSRYVYGSESLHDLLLGQFEDWYLELQDEIDVFLDYEEPRTFAQIVEAEQEFFDRVSYVRNHVHYDEDDPEPDDDRQALVGEWRTRMEAKYGRESLSEAIAQATTRYGSTATSAGSWLRSGGCSAASGISWTPDAAPRSHHAGPEQQRTAERIPTDQEVGGSNPSGRACVQLKALPRTGQGHFRYGLAEVRRTVACPDRRTPGSGSAGRDKSPARYSGPTAPSRLRKRPS
jgi:hypothetical protein